MLVVFSFLKKIRSSTYDESSNNHGGWVVLLVSYVTVLSWNAFLRKYISYKAELVLRVVCLFFKRLISWWRIEDGVFLVLFQILYWRKVLVSSIARRLLEARMISLYVYTFDQTQNLLLFLFWILKIRTAFLVCF